MVMLAVTASMVIVHLSEPIYFPGSVDVAQPEVDKFGWIRVGGQPIAAHYRDIPSAPLSYVDIVLKSKVDADSKVSDVKVPGANPARLEQDCKKLVQDLTAILAPQGNGFVKCLCDCTAMELIWTPRPCSSRPFIRSRLRTDHFDTMPRRMAISSCRP